MKNKDNIFAKIAIINGLMTETKLQKLNYNSTNLYAKLEYQNFMGSVKDRAVLYVLKQMIEKGIIHEETTVVESTSGNYGVALAAVCKILKIKFIAVIDPKISTEKEKIIRLLAYDVIKVTNKDSTGNYLIARLEKVKELLELNKNYIQPNQYENPDNYRAYYHTLAEEICAKFQRLDYAFVAVSTGGTITGLSLKLKEKYKNIKIIAVDVKGSMIFSQDKKERNIPGIGASIKSPILLESKIDEVLLLDEKEIIIGCHMLMDEQGIFAGGSSGAVYMAAKRYFIDDEINDRNSIMIFPDKGDGYIDTIYNKNWIEMNQLNSL